MSFGLHRFAAGGRRPGTFRALAYALLSLSAQTPAWGGALASVTSEIARLQLAFEVEAANLRGQYEQADAQLLAQYDEAVARFAREAQARGAFEPWQAGNRERARFAERQSIRKEHLVDDPAALRALQERAIRARIDLRRGFAGNVMDLTERLIARFDGLKRESTIRGDADGARLAQEAVVRARAAPAYTDALLALDESDAPAPPADHPANQIGANAAPAPAMLRIPNTPGIRVMESELPSVANNTVFVVCHLQPTAAGLAEAPKAVATARYTQRLQAVFQYPEQRFTADAVAVQVGVRAASGVGRLGPVVVVVEYFGRRGDEAPEGLAYTAVNLAALGSRVVTIDMPVTSYQIHMGDSAFGGVRRRFDRAYRFAGLIVSVFDATGAVLFQGVSDPALQPLAGDASRYRADGLLNRPTPEDSAP